MSVFCRTYGFILTVPDLSPNIGVLWWAISLKLPVLDNIYFLLLRCGNNISATDTLMQVLLCRSFWIFQKFLSDCFPYEHFVHGIPVSYTAEPPPLLSGFCVHCNLVNAQVLSFSKFSLLCGGLVFYRGKCFPCIY